MGTSESKYKVKNPPPKTFKKQQSMSRVGHVYAFRKCIFTGPQNDTEITYSSFVQINPNLQKLERGFCIQDFEEKVSKHNITNEFYVLLFTIIHLSRRN